MAEIIVEPQGGGWTIRHPLILFEQFGSCALAVRHRLRRALEKRDAACRIRLTCAGRTAVDNHAVLPPLRRGDRRPPDERGM